MGRTYLFGPPKWMCENCGRVNTMRKRPSIGHSVRKKCSGCDHYQEVSRTTPNLKLVFLIVAILVSIMAAGPAAIVVWILLWGSWVILKHYDEKEDSQSSSSGLSVPFRTPLTPHDPSNIETDVSGKWWYGIVAGIGLWLIIWFFVLTAAENMPYSFGYLLLINWAGLPVVAYFDMKFIRANGQWNPNTLLWMILFVVLLLNILAGVAYLYYRYKADVPFRSLWDFGLRA